MLIQTLTFWMDAMPKAVESKLETGETIFVK